MRKSIFCVLLSVVLLTGVFSPATLAEQADAAQITDDMTDWSIAAYHSENWERFLSHPREWAQRYRPRRCRGRKLGYICIACR